MQAAHSHIPVLLAETLQWLSPRPGECFVDATVGLGGHAEAILEQIGPGGRLIGIDQDPAALELTRERLERRSARLSWSHPHSWSLHRANFRHLAEVPMPAAGVDGILFDLGVSSMQLDLAERGFSFRGEGPLDMRMDPSHPLTAEELVNTRDEAALAHLIWMLGEERLSRRIARRIVERRPLRTTRELADLVAGCYPPAARHGRIHPATRVFQALRIAVNDELGALEDALSSVATFLSPGGRIVVLSYHSLEDRIVKRAFEFLSGRCRCPPEQPTCVCGTRPWLETLTRRPVTAGPAELAANPRARSARLRAARRSEQHPGP